QAAKQQTQQLQQQAAKPGETAPSAAPTPAQPGAAPSHVPAAVPGQPATRAAALAASPRIRIETPLLSGSIALKGARIDDLALTKYRETVDPKSPAIVLFAPSGTPEPYYAEFGWVGAGGASVKLPDQNTVWTQQGAGALTPSQPITLTYDNGEGLTFTRTISVDDQYMFSFKDEVANTGAGPVTLYPFALISRHGA